MEEKMKKMHRNCFDCGSDAVRTIKDEVKPIYKMTQVDFACGAVLKTIFTANGNIGRVSHSGCGAELSSPAL
jgi:hypothetical protein